jgi:hypothetical protein
MMKRILNAASSAATEGVGSGEHRPRSRGTAPSLFEGIFEVEERLLSVFRGREISFKTLLHEEALMRYTETNYRDAILKLEGEGRVAVTPPAEKRRFQAGGTKRTLPMSAIIRFGE